MKNPTLLTVILNYKTPDMTLRSAEAALREMAGIAGKIVIVDNDSWDGSFDKMTDGVAARGWDPARIEVVQSGRNGGFGAGNNFGVRYGLRTMSPDYIYFLNSDAFPDGGAIRRLIDHLESAPKTGIVGSYIHGEDNEPHLTAFRFPSIWGELEGAARIGVVSRVFSKHIVPLPIPPQTTPVDWLAGASMMIRREALDQVGLFDETYFLYFEETDLCLRARRAGWRTDYVRDSKVTHIGSVSTGMKTWARMPGYWFDSRQHYFKANHSPAYAATATLAHITGALMWRVWRLLRGKPKRDPSYFLIDLVTHTLGHRAVKTRKVPPLTSVQPAFQSESNHDDPIQHPA